MENFDAKPKCRAVVMKVASRCNLNCTYCYMYNLGDSTYLKQPKVMKDHVVDALLEQILVHCQTHGIDGFIFAFHGGEPLLAGKAFFRKFVEKANARLGPTLTLRFALQTNGTLLTDDWCQLLGELGVTVGISLDGTRESNDRYRIDHAGRGSYDRIVRGLKVAQASPHVKGSPGILAVIDINADPLEVYRHFKAIDVTRVDLLLPEANYEKPAPLPGNGHHSPTNTPYADWLIPIFEAWFTDTVQNKRPDIRVFSQIIQTILGSSVNADHYGTQNNELLMIETDGGIEAVDSLKMCGDGFTKEGMNVLTHTFDQALLTPLANLYQYSHKKLCKQCLNCPIREVCGGGFIPHRFSRQNGFNNPTVYCKDMAKLISHIQRRVVETLPAEYVEMAQLHSFQYQEILQLLETAVGPAGEDVQYALELESAWQ